MTTTWSKFYGAVVDAGLRAKNCPSGCDHWQILGGAQKVNCWPNTKRGFRMALDNGRGRPGTIAKAIKLAGPPEVPTPPAAKEYPAHEPDPPWEDKPHVGLIRWLGRRFWRLIW